MAAHQADGGALFLGQGHCSLLLGLAIRWSPIRPREKPKPDKVVGEKQKWPRTNPQLRGSTRGQRERMLFSGCRAYGSPDPEPADTGAQGAGDAPRHCRIHREAPRWLVHQGPELLALVLYLR